jgi:hypothetical protein
LISPSPRSFTPALLAAHQTRFHHGRSVDRHLGIDQAGINGGLYLADVDLIEHQGKRRIAEPALRQSPVQGHLAALEALDTHAGARGLSLAAATTRSCPSPSRCRVPMRMRFLRAPGLSAI